MLSPRLTFFAALALTLSFSTVASAGSATDFSARTRPVSVAVVGDSLANDLGNGMEDIFARKRNVHVIKQTRFATGLVRTDFFNWNATVRNALKHGDANILVVVIGGNDHQPIRVNGRRLDPLSKAWRAEYALRVGRFMDTVKHSRAKLYWVGLPNVRSAKLAHGYRAMNQIYKREAARHGFVYIDIWNKFHAKDAAYSSFGKSLEGVRRRIRMEDGMHFTEDGRKLFAAYIARAVGLR